MRVAGAHQDAEEEHLYISEFEPAMARLTKANVVDYAGPGPTGRPSDPAKRASVPLDYGFASLPPAGTTPAPPKATSPKAPARASGFASTILVSGDELDLEGMWKTTVYEGGPSRMWRAR